MFLSVAWFPHLFFCSPGLYISSVSQNLNCLSCWVWDVILNDGRFVSDKGAVVKTNANAEKSDEEEKGNLAQSYIYMKFYSLREWNVMRFHFYTLLGRTLMGVTVLIKFNIVIGKGILILYILEKFYFEQLINFSSSRKYSLNDYLVLVFIKEILTCVTIS